jgi:hypothetical protein
VVEENEKLATPKKEATAAASKNQKKKQRARAQLEAALADAKQTVAAEISRLEQCSQINLLISKYFFYEFIALQRSFV